MSENAIIDGFWFGVLISGAGYGLYRGEPMWIVAVSTFIIALTCLGTSMGESLR